MAVAIAVAGIAIPTSLVEAKAAGVTVKGTAPGAAKVFLLTKKGRAYRANVEASGAFSIAGVPGASVKNSTLQFTDATSKYLGTAVFRVVKSGKFWKSIVGLKAMSKGTLNVGSLKAMGGWYKAAKPAAAGTAGVRAADKTGKPKGAGLAGRVKLSTAKVASLSTLHKLAATTCPDGSPKDAELNGNEAGQDLDCDSVPNSIDVDDNGNGSLDILDQKTNNRDDKENYTASIATYSDMRGTMSSKLNTNAPGATLASLTTNITRLLSGTDTTGGSFQMAIFLGDWSLQGAAGELPDSVYIECPGIKWCDAATGTAKIYGNSEMNEIPGAAAQIDGKLWNTFASQDFSQAGFPKSTSAIYNGLYKFTQSRQNRWAAFLMPNYKEADVLKVVRANDVMVMHSIAGTNDVSIPVTVSPFFVTTPYLKSATVNGATVTNTDSNFNAGNIKIGDDGKLGVEFWRPQRMKLDGENGNAGDFSALTSQHGLNYGLQITGGSVNNKAISSFPETGCAGTDVEKYYSSKTLKPSAQSYGPVDQDPASDFWAMNDATADDSEDNVLDMTLDLKGCITDHKPSHFAKGGFADFAGKTVGQILGFSWADFISSGNNYLEMSLTGVGSPSTNGYNRSVLQFKVYSSKWTGQSGGSSSNNNSGSNNNNSGNSGSGSNNNSGSSSSAPATTLEISVKSDSLAAVGLVGVGGTCATQPQSGMAAGSSCSGEQTATTIILDGQGNSGTISLVGGETAPDIVTPTNGNQCTPASGNQRRLVCSIPRGQGTKKIVVTIS
ncbi:MAG: hypothetical protein KGQ43_08355 [Acidobacteria bacterium]|nr:hypothetical protein [Acidobacteriota bacterium]